MTDIPEFGEPPADAPAARPFLHDVLLAGFWARYPALVRYLLAERGLPPPPLTDPAELVARECEEGLLRLLAEEAAGAEDLAAEPEPDEEDEREPGERDPWRTYRRVSHEERDDLLARYRLPFRVLAVRLWTEASGRPRWHLLIEMAPLRTLGVVKVPHGHRQRDQQLAWLRDQRAAGNHRELSLCFFHQEAGKYRRLALTRCEWLAGPEARPDLPAAVRRYLETGTDPVY